MGRRGAPTGGGNSRPDEPGGQARRSGLQGFANPILESLAVVRPEIVVGLNRLALAPAREGDRREGRPAPARICGDELEAHKARKELCAVDVHGHGALVVEDRTAYDDGATEAQLRAQWSEILLSEA